MKNKIQHIFSSTECLTEEMLIKYIKNKISTEERHSVEVHLTDCEMCQDLLAGLSEFQNYDKLPIVINELNSMVDFALKTEPKIIVLDFYRIFMLTASILLLVTLTYFITLYYINYQNYFTQNSKFEFGNNAIVINNSETQTSDELMVIVSRPKYTDEQKQELNKIKQNKNNIIADNIYDNEVIVDDISVEELANNDFYEKKIIDNYQLSESENVEAINTTEDIAQETLVSKTIVNSDLANVTTMITGNSHSQRNNINNGFDDFKSEKYEKAKTIFEAEISENPDNDTALFYKGLSDYQLQNFEDANILFDIILENPKSSFYEDALYFKALIYINSGNEKSAKEYLYQVIDYNGKYIDMAKQKLTELK